MKPSNVRKIKGTTKCDKKIVTYDIRTTQYEDETIKYDILVTEYSRLLTSSTVPPKKRGYGKITLTQVILAYL